MSERDRDRDRPKKSWREVDAQRDRSGAGQGGGKTPPRQSEIASKQYRAQLDALFEKGEVGKFAEKLAGGPPSLRGAEARPAPKIEAEPEAAPVAPKEDPRVVLRKKLIESIGRDDITRAFDRYLKAHGMPGDFELLEQGLEHSKKQLEVLDALDKLLDKEKPKRSRTLAGKLRFIEETSTDDDLRAAAIRVRAKLG